MAASVKTDGRKISSEYMKDRLLNLSNVSDVLSKVSTMRNERAYVVGEVRIFTLFWAICSC